VVKNPGEFEAKLLTQGRCPADPAPEGKPAGANRPTQAALASELQTLGHLSNPGVTKDRSAALRGIQVGMAAWRQKEKLALGRTADLHVSLDCPQTARSANAGGLELRDYSRVRDAAGPSDSGRAPLALRSWSRTRMAHSQALAMLAPSSPHWSRISSQGPV
jgi:hypothetical protein